MRDASILDKQVPSGMLDVAMKDPDFWLMDVSALELDCPDLQPYQALFLPPSLPHKSR